MAQRLRWRCELKRPPGNIRRPPGLRILLSKMPRPPRYARLTLASEGGESKNRSLKGTKNLLRRGHKTQTHSTMTAAAPRCAAASVTVAAATAASAATAATVTAICTTTTTTSAAAAAAAHRYLREAAGAVFLVEDVECSKISRRLFPLREERGVDWMRCSEIAEDPPSQERKLMRFPPAKDPVQRRLEPVHQRLWSDASGSKLASPGTSCILRVPVAGGGWHDSDVG